MTVGESCFAVLALELVIKHVQILKRWCDDSSCAPSSCDCEQNSLCNGYKWLVIHLMVHFSCVPLSCDCEWISFCNGCKWPHSSSYGPFSCVPLGCDCGWISFCNGYKWTRSLSFGPFSCVPLGCDCEWILFAMVTSELVIHVMFLLDVTLNIQWPP